MSVFTISDIHLSTHESTNKSMEVFGKRWDNYIERIRTNWERLILPEDTVIIPGDISWALSLNEALSDLKFIDSLPGKKILGKGNHDFWWTSMKKHGEFFEKHGISSVSFLFNNAHAVDDVIIAGTRGWYYDEDAANIPSGTDYQKLAARESQRLRTSLNAANTLREGSDKEIVVFMHFPPFWNDAESADTFEILNEFGVKRLFYGHIHGNYTVPALIQHKGVDMRLVSADYLGFIPKIV